MDRESVRQRLRAPALREELTGPGRFWRFLEVLEETGSTNSDLTARAAAGEDVDGVVLIAEHQTAGRGRMGRQWSAAPHSQVAMSVGVGARDVPTASWGWLSLAAGVAVVDAVAAVTGVEARLKWPNDVLVDGAKLAGILAEVSGRVIVVGIGLNVTLHGDEVGESGATSLLDLGVDAPDRTRLAAEMLLQLGRRISNWRGAGGADDELRADYRRSCLTIGSPVRATLPGGDTVEGQATAVDDQGRLCITVGTETVEVAAADVVQLRPVQV